MKRRVSASPGNKMDGDLKPTLAAMLGVLLLAACGDSSTLAQRDMAPRLADNPFAVAMATKAQARYRLANACYAIQDAAGGKFIQATDGGQVVAAGDDLATATPFWVRATTLGRYAFYGPQARFMTLAASAEDVASGAEDLIAQLGYTVSGVGDFIDLEPTIHPVADAVDGVGEAVTEGGFTLGETLRAGPRSLVMQGEPVNGSEWTVAGEEQQFTISNTLTGDLLLAGQAGDTFRFVATTGCADFPEAQLNATGTPFKGTNPDGTVFGYAETHMHLGGTEMFGGRLGYGKPFHKFGIEHALGNCSENHGPNGDLGLVDIAVNPNQGPPQHDTQGWPTFVDWPSYGGQIHHQTYYMWLKRAWMGGLRLMVNHLVANEGLCLLWPIKGHDCNEMETLEIERQLTLDLQDYIDAQAGGPGKGFFRIVYSSAEARQAIEAGQMAVILGTENEKIFDCGEYLDTPDCSEAGIERDLADWWDRGIRAIFPIHLVDNAFGGTRLTDDPALTALYSAANIVDTGHPYAGVDCEGPDNMQPGDAQPSSRGIFDTILLLFTNPPPAPPVSGCQRNARGITPLGEYFTQRLIDKGIMIETDHTGVLARNRIFDIAEQRGVPVFSGHTGTIGPSKDSDRILQTGGIISQLPDGPSNEAVSFIQDLEALQIELFGSTKGLATGLGSDINGIHNQAPPRDDAAEHPLQYPFRSYDGQVTFERQVSGQRVYDLNTDGVAHYGLFPDYLADIQQLEGGDKALRYIFRSAEAYLQRWSRVEQMRVEN